jgi:hypothetical protein
LTPAFANASSSGRFGFADEYILPASSSFDDGHSEIIRIFRLPFPATLNFGDLHFLCNPQAPHFGRML